MSHKSKTRNVIRPQYDSDSGYESYDELSRSLGRNQTPSDEDEDDEFSSISFGALNSAQKKLISEQKKQKGKKKSQKKSSEDIREFHDDEVDSEDGSEDDSDSDSDSDSDAAPRERSTSRKQIDKKKRSKHAPAVASSKRPVSKIREIPGLKSKKDSTLYTDIRFDAAYGKADFNKIRKDYAFLDEYRQQEIKDMQSILKDKKSSAYLSDRQLEDIQFKMQSLKSRVETMKNRDFETQLLRDHKKEQMDKFKAGEQNTPFFLKRSDKRKMLQKARFDRMKSSQREKVMERKRKKRLGKEFRQLEFNRPQH
ncbi:uncharacterized protein RJT21DRAFT_117053 [Scheffersomyces amazonensis]|uniref:uncharacterized protein n=1 Tax=Scheffersomyces amazonensis TaxID=1078765 RepID=UPI00315C5E50